MFMCHSLNKGAEIQNAHFIVWSYIWKIENRKIKQIIDDK